jgi:hypothetical protein
MIDYSHGEYRHCAPVTVPLRTISGRGEGTGSAASTGRRECTGTTPNVQQWLVPSQTRCALGNLARASLSVMQAGEPLASDGPIMIATARIGIMRIVIAKPFRPSSKKIASQQMNTGSLAIFAGIGRASLEQSMGGGVFRRGRAGDRF